MGRIENHWFLLKLWISVFSTLGQATVEICHFLFSQILDRQSHLLEQLVASRPTLALSHCWPDFFCSASCQHARQAAVSCVRLSLQEAVSKRYSEISEMYSEQKLGREVLAFCADPSVILNSHKIFNKIIIVWEMKYYNTAFSHVLRLSLKSNWLQAIETQKKMSKGHWYE